MNPPLAGGRRRALRNLAVLQEFPSAPVYLALVRLAVPGYSPSWLRPRTGRVGLVDASGVVCYVQHRLSGSQVRSTGERRGKAVRTRHDPVTVIGDESRAWVTGVQRGRREDRGE